MTTMSHGSRRSVARRSMSGRFMHVSSKKKWSTGRRPALHSTSPRVLRQHPPLAVLAADERVRLRGVAGLHAFGVPLQLLARAVGHVAEVVGLGQPAGVLEVGER